jgi:hypothetical protein
MHSPVWDYLQNNLDFNGKKFLPMNLITAMEYYLMPCGGLQSKGQKSWSQRCQRRVTNPCYQVGLTPGMQWGSLRTTKWLYFCFFILNIQRWLGINSSRYWKHLELEFEDIAISRRTHHHGASSWENRPIHLERNWLCWSDSWQCGGNFGNSHKVFVLNDLKVRKLIC